MWYLYAYVSKLPLTNQLKSGAGDVSDSSHVEPEVGGFAQLFLLTQ
jgi:hypothetical protein